MLELALSIDRLEKPCVYQTIASLQDSLLISQTGREVEIHQRARNWTSVTVTESSVQLDCLDVALPLDAIYADVPTS